MPLRKLRLLHYIAKRLLPDLPSQYVINIHILGARKIPFKQLLKGQICPYTIERVLSLKYKYQL